jgi:hypothetical protein
MQSLDERATWQLQRTLDPLNPLAASQLDQILSEAGARAVSRNDDPRHMDKVFRLMELIERAQRNDYQALLLKEALSTSDFPILFGDIMDRQLLGTYQVWPKIWPSIAKRGTSTRITPELTGVPENDNLTETGYTLQVSVYSRAFMIDWQMMVNDDTGAFTDLAPRLAQGAARSEDFYVTSLFADANGPHASFYTSGNKNIVNTTNGASATNPALSLAALQDAMTVLRKQVDPVTSEPIFIDVMVLVVPPALEVIAKNIMFSTGATMGGYTAGDAGGGGTETQQLRAINWWNESVRLVVDPYLPIVSATANGDRAWYLFAEPNSNRPALEVDFLRGYENPTIFQKAPNTMRLGGGLDATMGDFETLSLRFKGMNIFGGARVSPLMTVASNGSGS